MIKQFSNKAAVIYLHSQNLPILIVSKVLSASKHSSVNATPISGDTSLSKEGADIKGIFNINYISILIAVISKLPGRITDSLTVSKTSGLLLYMSKANHMILNFEYMYIETVITITTNLE